MFVDTSDADSYEDVLSVDELEDLLSESPNDLALREDLAAALVDRLVYGDDQVGPGDEQDIQRLRETLACLPSEKALFARAYAAYLNSDDAQAAHWLVRYARGDDDGISGESFSADELYLDVIISFSGVSRKFWSELAAGLAKFWPNTAAALVVAGYVNQDENRLLEAFNCYDHALQKDPEYWIAAWGLAEVYYLAKEWQAACHYYERALQSQLAREVPSLNFQAAYNLGWALYRQGRFEEALAIFEDCIARNVDGAHPRRNKARALVRLGRVAEAMEVWKQTEPDRRLTKQRQGKIIELHPKIKRGKTGPAGLLDDEDGSLPES